MSANQDPSIVTVFPKTGELESKRFSLLRRAYIDARYDRKNYHITHEDLVWLGDRVELLKELTKNSCTKKIKTFV